MCVPTIATDRDRIAGSIKGHTIFAMADYDPDFERAQQDRLSGGGGTLVSVAYWIVRGVSGLFGLILRFARSRRSAG
jgi:hypothetical protein